MRFAPRYLLASAVLVVAGVLGVGLSTTPQAEYIRNPYYRDALAIEKDFEWLDVAGFEVDEGNISIGIIFLADPPNAEAEYFVEYLNDLVQKYVDHETRILRIWVLYPLNDTLYANGLFLVTGNDLRTKGVTDETLYQDEAVFYRWIIGAPYQFIEGTWLWAGR